MPIYTGLYRLWARARAVETAAWEKAHAQPFYSAAKGSSPVDAVWTQMAKAEEAGATGLHMAAHMMDLEAFI